MSRRSRSESSPGPSSMRWSLVHPTRPLRRPRSARALNPSAYVTPKFALRRKLFGTLADPGLGLAGPLGHVLGQSGQLRVHRLGDVDVGVGLVRG